MNKQIAEINDAELEQVVGGGGGFWGSVVDVLSKVDPAVYVAKALADNWINPSKVGDAPIKLPTGGVGGSDVDPQNQNDGAEGAGGDETP